MRQHALACERLRELEGAADRNAVHYRQVRHVTLLIDQLTIEALRFGVPPIVLDSHRDGVTTPIPDWRDAPRPQPAPRPTQAIVGILRPDHVDRVQAWLAAHRATG